jgi:hypothetical protein
MAHRNGQPGDEPEIDEKGRRLGGALSHPNRHHVTLDNLADLADLVQSAKADAAGAGGGAVTVDEADLDGDDEADEGDDESWLSNLAAPADDQPRLKKRSRGRSRDKDKRPKGAAEPDAPGGDPGPDGAPGTASGSGASGATGAMGGTDQVDHHIRPGAYSEGPYGSANSSGQWSAVQSRSGEWQPPLSASQELAVVPPAAPPATVGPTPGQELVVHEPPTTELTTTGQHGALSTGEHRAGAWVVASARPQVHEAIELPPASETAPERRRRSVWGRVVDRWLLEMMAVAVAAVAFVAPTVWLLTITGFCIVGGVVSYVASGRSLASLPNRIVKRSFTLLHPRSSLWVPVLAARTVIVALILSGAMGALRWTLDEGSEGVVAAARAGAWSHGFRVAVVLVCLMLLTSVGDGRNQRAATVRRWAAPATDGTLVTLAVTCVIVLALAVAAAPHPVDPIAAKADGLGWLPPGTRSYADRLRDDVVTTELDSLASCLSTRGETTWSPSYTSDNPLADPDIARLEARREPSNVPPGDLATVIMAAHNQLAPWVEYIEIEWPGGDLVRTDRSELPRFEPLTDARLLVAATATGGQWLSSSSLDRAVGLRCSAAPVL